MLAALFACEAPPAAQAAPPQAPDTPPQAADTPGNPGAAALINVAGGDLAAVTVDYPLNGSIFPPDMIAPTFLWHDDAPEADRWEISVAINRGKTLLTVIADGPPPPAGEIDERCIAETNEIYQPTEYQASAHSWTPSDADWQIIKDGSVTKAVVVAIVGFNSAQPDVALSRGKMTLTTSTDPVGAPIFYRDVPLIPARNEKGNIKPIPDNALHLVTWRLRDVSRQDNRVVLTDIPTCANCHSFSLDGKTMGMDIDGPSGDKGAYGIVDIEQNTVITANDIVTWNAYKDKPKGQKTIGFLSRISPDGRYAISTVNESIYSAGFNNFRFLQVFFPTRGILAVYDRTTRRFESLPGADDTQYVQCDPVWSPDSKWIVFARAEARDPYVEGAKEPEYPNHENETPMQYDLYRVPFNGGKGGQAERIVGASENGMSNTFPKVSPDGKWIVYVQCRNGQLQRPDSRLWIVPLEGGEAREMNCNQSLMNSWHSFSPNSRWMVFSSKANTPYTQMFLTHIDEDGNDSPPILIPNSTAANRAVNLPEFVNIAYDDLITIDAPTINYYRYYERGNALREEGKFEEAMAEYLIALAAEPTSTRVNNNIGLCLVRLERFDEAQEYYRAALELFPDDPRSVTIYCNLGVALAAQGNVEEAMEQYEIALALDPRSLSAHLNMAGALTGLNQTDLAIEHCLKALDIEPSSARTHYALGSIYYNRGQAAQAIEHWAKTIEIDPDYVSAYASWGAVLANQGETNEAIELYNKALAINPDHLPAIINLGAALTSQGRKIEGIKQYRKALSLSPESVYLLNKLGIALARQGEVDEAIELFTKALKIEPSNPASRKNLDTAMAQKNRADN